MLVCYRFFYYLIFAVLFFVGMGVVVVSRPMFGLWGRLVFWFGRFLWFCWDVGVVFVLVHYVGCMLDGMGRGWGDTWWVKNKLLDKAHMFCL